MLHAPLRRAATLLLAVTLLLALAASAARAEAPPLVIKNMRAITELEYKYFDPGHGDSAYPTCHSACEELFKGLDSFGGLDELYLLAARTGLTANFNNEPFPLTGSAVDAEVKHGYVTNYNGPMRYSGLQVPGVNAFAQFSSAQIQYPNRAIEGFWFAGTDTQLVTPGVGWVGNTGVLNSCAGSPSDDPGANPGDGWQLIGINAQDYYCARWNPATQDWDHLQGSAYLWAWWHPATFYGPSKLDPWKGTDNPQTMDISTRDPGFALGRSRTLSQLDNGVDYDALIEYFDHALGGDWTPTPRDLDGDGNPAAPNLKHAYCGDPVNCATGNFTESYDDTTVRGPGVTLSQERSYNSQQAAEASAPGPFGHGWSATFRASLTFPDASTVVVHNENGSEAAFDEGYDGNYAGGEFVQATLTKLANGHYKYTLPDQLTYEFDADGHLLSETDNFGNRTTLAYDGGDVTSVTDPVGRTLDYTYNSDGTVATVTDPAGHEVRYAYTGGDLTSVTDAGGGVTHFAYDADHQITSVTDPRGHVVTHNTYDSQHRVISQTDALSHATTWDYGTGETTVTDPSGSVTREEFQDLLPTAITKAVGTASEATTRFAYDDAYNMVEKTDADGKHWRYDYDLSGNLVTSTDPLGHATTYTYDDAHRVTQVQKPGGLITLLRYAPNGNGELQTVETPAIGYQRAYWYDGYGQAAGGGDYAGGGGFGRYWDYGRDAHGNLTSATSAAGRRSSATYDADGFTLTTTTARGKTTTITRDAFEQPATVVDARGKTTTYGYDADENPTSVTDRNGHTETTVFDDMNRPTEDHRPDGSVWRTTYDAAGAIATRVDGRGKTTSYTYDHQHRLHTKTDPLEHETVYDYDGAGNLTSATLPDGTTRALSYDDAGRLTGVDYSGGSSEDVTFAYDVDDHRTSMTDGTGTTSYNYDVDGRLQSQTSAAGQTTTYHYDGWSRVSSIDYPDALSVATTGAAPAHVTTGTVTRAYDADDNLTGVTDWLGHTTSFAYDGDDDQTGVTRPNGVNATYTYDDVGALASITDDTPATSLARDDERQLSGTDDGTSPASLSYDDADRLTSALGRTYAYDDSDDLTQTATAAGAPVQQQFDDAGELTGRTAAGIPVATLGYDDDGQRTSMTPSGGGATTYAWTHAGRLASYSGPDLSGGGGATTTSESYTYDGDGLRQTVTTGDQRRHEAWDISGSVPLMITDGPTSYITGPGGLPVEQITGDGTVRYFSHDQLGSTTALTDASGTTVQQYRYDVYGQLTSAAPTIENPFRYAGQFTDTTTGLQYLRGRYYDASTGQFISRDPLEGDTLQPYAYAGDDPANAVDPSGLSFTSRVADAVSSVVPSQVSDVAARTVDILTGGAGSDIACNGLNWKNGTEAGVSIALAFVPGGEEEMLGLEEEARAYVNITKGGSIRNIGTDATHEEFTNTLTHEGWSSQASKDGAVRVFQKDGAKYVLREQAGSHPGWTADYTPAGSSAITLKIRLGYQP